MLNTGAPTLTHECSQQRCSRTEGGSHPSVRHWTDESTKRRAPPNGVLASCQKERSPDTCGGASESLRNEGRQGRGRLVCSVPCASRLGQRADTDSKAVGVGLGPGGTGSPFSVPVGCSSGEVTILELARGIVAQHRGRPERHGTVHFMWISRQRLKKEKKKKNCASPQSLVSTFPRGPQGPHGEASAALEEWDRGFLTAPCVHGHSSAWSASCLGTPHKISREDKPDNDVFFK